MPKDKDTKFSEDELKKVKDIQQNYIDIQHRLGQLSVAEIRLEQQIDAIDGQRKSLTTTFKKNQDDEKDFIHNNEVRHKLLNRKIIDLFGGQELYGKKSNI